MGVSPKNEDLSTEELFRRFAPFVARFLYRLGVRSDGLDDLVQEVFLVVHSRGGYKAGPAKPTSYLATIATNAASAYRRRQRVEQARSSDAEVEGLMSTSKGPVQVLEVAERLRLLQAALDRLEPDFRSTIVLADIEGESCASIAASSGVPTGTVYWRLHEARKRFQRALRAEMAGIPPKGLQPDSEAALGAGNRARGSALLFAFNPLWFLSGARRLLREGAIHAPVHYDVHLGLETHRALARTLVASHAPSVAPAIVAGTASTGAAIAGAGGVGVAAAAVIAAGFYLRSMPAAPIEERSAARTALVSRTDASGNAASPVSASTASREPSPAGTSVKIPFESLPVAVPSNGRTEASPASNAAGKQPRTTASSGVSPPSKAPDDEATPEAPREPSVASTNTQLEAQEIARAEHLLSSNPAEALALVRGARARFRPSFLPEERDYVEVMALQALGRSDEAQAAASRFLNAYPGGAFGNRVRRVMGR